MSTVEKLIKVSDAHIQNVFGQFDVNMKKIERICFQFLSRI